MRKVITILNALMIVLAAYLVFVYGKSLQFLIILVFGMALASMHGEQKKLFHVITIILNIGCVLLGIFAIYGIFSYGNEQELPSLGLLVPLIVAFIIVPFFNSKYAFEKIQT